MASAFIAAAGLVVDGGLALAGKTSAIDEAQQAARTAATALSPGPLRTGHLHLDTNPAINAAQAYITHTGDTGTVTLTDTRIHVHIEHRQPTQILALLGLTRITVTGDATARVETGTNQPDPAGAQQP
jgi:hypothetical protein